MSEAQSITIPPDVEDFDDYKAYLRERILRARGVKGYGRLLAEAAGCHPSFLSQVLNGPTQLTPDQAAGLSEFWALDETRTEIFLILVQRARSSSPAFRRILDRKLTRLRGERRDLAKRFGAPRLPDAEEVLYYSSWLWSAAHVLTSIPRYGRVEALAKRLGVTIDALEPTLQGLERMGLLEKKGEKWKRTGRSLHLPRESPLYLQHLLNWRHRALIEANGRSPDTVHYSAVHGLSRADADRLRAMIVRFIDETREVVVPSPEEEAVCLNIDYFPI
jgi:uncharacterized protein (TIGR02147 family)